MLTKSTNLPTCSTLIWPLFFAQDFSAHVPTGSLHVPDTDGYTLLSVQALYNLPANQQTLA